MWGPLWNQVAESRKEPFCGEVVPGQYQAGAECIFEARAGE